MARQEFKAFVNGSEYLIEDHNDYITIRGDGGGKILDVHKDTAAELVAILEYMGLVLKKNDLSIEEAERMELNDRDILDVLGKCENSFIDKPCFDIFDEDTKKTFHKILGTYNVYVWSKLVEAATKKLDRMAEASE